jgi:hypothetical protein
MLSASKCVLAQNCPKDNRRDKCKAEDEGQMEGLRATDYSGYIWQQNY